MAREQEPSHPGWEDLRSPASGQITGSQQWEWSSALVLHSLSGLGQLWVMWVPQARKSRKRPGCPHSPRPPEAAPALHWVETRSHTWNARVEAAAAELHTGARLPAATHVRVRTPWHTRGLSQGPGWGARSSDRNMAPALPPEDRNERQGTVTGPTQAWAPRQPRAGADRARMWQVQRAKADVSELQKDQSSICEMGG